MLSLQKALSILLYLAEKTLLLPTGSQRVRNVGCSRVFLAREYYPSICPTESELLTLRA